MSAFEFVFSLYGLLLGLSLAEVLRGLARALRRRDEVRIGWLTPMLGLFVTVDLISFWSFAWETRGVLEASFRVLLFGGLASGIYYFAATLVFPASPDDWNDLDDHYRAHRRQVLGAVLVVAVLTYAGSFALGLRPANLGVSLVYAGIFIALMLAAMIVRGRAASAGLLAALIGMHLFTALAE